MVADRIVYLTQLVRQKPWVGDGMTNMRDVEPFKLGKCTLETAVPG